MPLYIHAKDVVGQSRLSVPVRITVEDGSVEGVTVYLNNIATGTITETPGKSKMNLELVLNQDYVLTFSKKGYITKRIAFNTSMPAGRLTQELYPFNFEVVLFPQYEGLNIVVFNQPVAKIFFDPLLDDFDYDTDYTKQIQSALKQAEEQIVARQKEETQKGEQKSKTGGKPVAVAGQDSSLTNLHSNRQTNVDSLPATSVPAADNKLNSVGSETQKRTLDGSYGSDSRGSNMNEGFDRNIPVLAQSIGSDNGMDGNPVVGADPNVGGLSQGQGGDIRSSIDTSSGMDVGGSPLTPSTGKDSNTITMQSSQGADTRSATSVVTGGQGMDVDPATSKSLVKGSSNEGSKIIQVNEYTESGKNILNITVLTNGVEEQYRKVKFHWGGVYYYKSNDSISQAYFFAVTGYR